MSTNNMNEKDMRKICATIINQINKNMEALLVEKFQNFKFDSPSTAELSAMVSNLNTSLTNIEDSLAKVGQKKKRRPSGYILYSQHQRATLTAQGNKVTIQQLSKMWGAETDTVKSEWNSWAKLDEKPADKPSTGNINDIYSTAVALISVEMPSDTDAIGTIHSPLHKVATIRAELEKNGLDTTGKKSELVKRLRNHMHSTDVCA